METDGGLKMHIYNDWLFIQNFENTKSPEAKSQKIDTFSTLPTDVLNEMMGHLPLRDLNALKLTSNGIKHLTKNHFPLATQNFLENLIICLLKDSYVKRLLSNESHQDFKEKYETLLNGSVEKCQALRAFICSIFNEQTSLYSAIDILEPLHFYEDHFLPPFMIKNMGVDNDDSAFLCSFSYNDLKTLNLSLDMLENNRLNPKILDFRCSNIYLSKQILGKLLSVIRKNTTINEVQLNVFKWNYSDLKALLEAINDNTKIRKIEITEDSLELWIEDKWFWEREVQSWRIETINKIVYQALADDFFLVKHVGNSWSLKR